MAERLVVIGGDAAGMSAASQARRRRSETDLEIVAFERGHYTSYSACGIPYFLSGTVADFDRLIIRSPERFRERYGIDARVRHEVVEIDLDRRTVLVRDLDAGRDHREGFDQLMVATGATPVRPPWPGIDATGVFGVQVLDDARAVDRALDERPRSAAVVGSGYIGLELAEALKIRGLDVTVIESAPAPMATLDPDMGAIWPTPCARRASSCTRTNRPRVSRPPTAT